MRDRLVDRQSIGTHPLAAVPRPGSMTLRRAHGDAALSYYVYVPAAGIGARTPVLVSVHGISRNARAHGRAFAALAEQHGFVIVSPLFASEFYPDFQRLGIVSGRHPDQALDAMLTDVGTLLGLDVGRFALFGYSGGAQFAHRYALANPHRVVALAAASAGWYTWPTAEHEFPFGLSASAARPDFMFRLLDFLAIPLCVLIGARDTRRDKALRRSHWLDAIQGRNRLERARAWFAELERVAALHGIERRAELTVLDASEHDFVLAVELDAIEHRAIEFLYDANRSAAAQTPLLGALA